MRDRPGPQRAALVPCLDRPRAAAGYRSAAALAPEPAATARELAQLPPAGGVGDGLAWRAFCCGWLRG